MVSGRTLSFLIFGLILVSCGSPQQLVQSYPENPTDPSNKVLTSSSNSSEEEINPELLVIKDNPEEHSVSKIIRYAKEFLGTKYRYGGTGPDGMDCSGLICTAFSQEDIQLPRTSREMATNGEKIDLEQVTSGDLLFFKTDALKNSINHVGLVVDISEDGIYFIHSTTSRGVIISSMTEKYWQNHFIMARRIQ